MSAITLTPYGKQMAEDTTSHGPEFAVLALLYEANGPVDFEEIVDELRMDEEKASMLVRSLINKGYIREIA